MWAFHNILTVELDEFNFLGSPLMKLLLLNGGKTEHINQLLSKRVSNVRRIVGPTRIFFSVIQDETSSI